MSLYSPSGGEGPGHTKIYKKFPPDGEFQSRRDLEVSTREESEGGYERKCGTGPFEHLTAMNTTLANKVSKWLHHRLTLMDRCSGDSHPKDFEEKLTPVGDPQLGRLDKAPGSTLLRSAPSYP